MGIPVRQAIEAGLLQIGYMPSEVTQSEQFLTVLTNKIDQGQIRRQAFDDIDCIRTAATSDQMPYLLHRFGLRFKALGVTSLFTLAATGASPMAVGTLAFLSDTNAAPGLCVREQAVGVMTQGDQVLGRPNFLALPLVNGRSQIFGVLQADGARQPGGRIT